MFELITILPKNDRLQVLLARCRSVPLFASLRNWNFMLNLHRLPSDRFLLYFSILQNGVCDLLHGGAQALCRDD